MLSNNQNQPKCLKCGMPIKAVKCPNCGFNVKQESLLSIDKTGQVKDFYKSELAFFKEHNVDYCYQTGLKYYNDGNYEEAFKWYQKSAKQGHAAAQNYLGYMYEFGKGIEQNYVEAVKWYKKAAEQGNARAQCNLGNMYAHGQGVKQNYAEALKWYKLAAEQGYAIGQSNLGNMFYWGKGVEQNYAEAIKWYEKAVEQGHQEAKEKLLNLTTNNYSKAENNNSTSLKYSRDKVFFGSYYQNSQDKKKSIEWQILEKKRNKVLLISKFALDCKKYNETFTATSWEECTLRKWLNSDFIRQTFTVEEQSMIADTHVSADVSSFFSDSPGNATIDKVFLLSIPEVEHYFSSDNDRQCKGTKYCIDQGVDQSDGHVWWWLRSPGNYANSAANVTTDGSVDNYGYYVHYDDCAVRPALWVNLES